MHAMVFHVPGALQKYGNVKQFTGQGIWAITGTFILLCLIKINSSTLHKIGQAHTFKSWMIKLDNVIGDKYHH